MTFTIRNLLVACLLLLAPAAHAATNSLLIQWRHHTLDEPLTRTVATSNGTITISNEPTIFHVYRSTDLTNWIPVGSVFHTNRFNYTHTNAPVAVWFAVTASNRFAGETPFSEGVGARYLLGGATNTTLTKQ